MCYLYILQSLKNKRYYIGSTNNLPRRLEEHYSGRSKYTREILPAKLIFQQKYPSLHEARKAEQWLKKQKDANLIRKILTDNKIAKSFQ